MIERDTCYFCTSPFQLYAIIALALQRKEIADLYIDPQFVDANQFAERIRKLNIFVSVKIIDSEKIYTKFFKFRTGLKNHFQIANSYLHVKDVAQMILIPNVRYNNIFVSSKAYLPRMVNLFYIKQKYSYNIFYFDDGAGTYCNDRAYSIKTSDKIIRRILFGKQATKKHIKRFVFAPEIYKLLNKEADVERIDRIWDNADGKSIMNAVFSISSNVLIKEKAIILDQPREDLFDQEENKKIEYIYNLIVKKFGYENVVLKRHPRSKMDDNDRVKHMNDTGVPFETYCLNMDMNNKILVTYSSTGVATPKILFNQEPIVIVLSKLLTTIKGEKNMFEEFYISVKESYTCAERFYIPGSIDELRDIVKKL